MISSPHSVAAFNLVRSGFGGGEGYRGGGGTGARLGWGGELVQGLCRGAHFQRRGLLTLAAVYK